MLADALKLSASDRAEIAEELLRSLDEEEGTLPPEEVDRLWVAEIARRTARAIHGDSEGLDARAALAASEAKLRR